jgi:hypothetical protein
MARLRKFRVAVYKADGTFKSEVILDPRYDSVDCFPVSDNKLAQEYFNRYLKTGDDYCIIS